jgi:hypothetical protein
MIPIYVVGDGLRDEAMVPVLVERVVRLRVQARFRPWSSLRLAGGGYDRKLKFAVREAVEEKIPMLVATVDTDKDNSGEKLRRLRQARSDDPQCGSLVQVALGEATPHGEAWLLDDEVAVRQALGLHSSTPICTPANRKNPKQAIEDLRHSGNRCDDPIRTVLAAIAQLVQPARCPRSKDTGFDALQDDLRTSIRNSKAACDDGCPCGDCSGVESDGDQVDGE